MKVARGLLLLLLIFASPVMAQTSITVQHYAIDSSTSQVFNPLSIPRFQIAPLSGAGDAVFYTHGFTGNNAFVMTYNLDSTVRWVGKNMGAVNDLDHAHISVYRDTVYLGRNSDNRLYALTRTGIDSLQTLFTYQWPLTETDLYIASAYRLPGSDTVISISRGLDDNNAIRYWISTDKGQSFGPQQWLVNRVGTGRVRIGAMIYDNTVAVVVDSGDYSIGWYTWNRSTRQWMNDGKTFNRSMYRGFAGNAYLDTIRFVIGSRDNVVGGIDSVLWAFKSKNASTWTQGAFQSFTADVGVPPYVALTYIEASRRLVLFYSQSDYANDDSISIYMRYWRPEITNWSSPTKVSRGRYVWKVTTAQRVPASHGDVCYAMYPCIRTVGGSNYNFADVVRITFSSDDVTAPGAIQDLSATFGDTPSQVRLAWTAPGDDGNSGSAEFYVVKSSSSPINASNWGTALTVPSYPPVPGSSGTPQQFLVSGLPTGQATYFAVRAYDSVGNESPISNSAFIDLSLPVDEPNTPDRMATRIGSIYPNPFNGATRINYHVGERSDVSLTIYDILGRRVNKMLDATLPRGEYSTVWNGTDDRGNEVGSGVYFCHIASGGWADSRKLVYLK